MGGSELRSTLCLARKCGVAAAESLNNCPYGKIGNCRRPESYAASKGRFPAGLIVTILSLFLFLLYVLSAPFAIDAQGFQLRTYAPVWWAVQQRPFSAVLKPYFKLCGIEFGTSDEGSESE